MFYLIGLGLNEKGISIEGLEILKKCRKVYLESYTIDFPYSVENLEKNLGKKVIRLERKEVESKRLVGEAKKQDVALLIYGSPLFATTHISLLLDAKEQGVKVKAIHNASIFDAVAETGLQPYKFGKTASMAKWLPEKNYKPDSFIKIIKDNQKIKAHTLLLIDIGFKFAEALEQLEEICKNQKIKLGKIVACSQLGTNESRTFYGGAEKLKFAKIEPPFCIIIPSDELHFLEKEGLENVRIK